MASFAKGGALNKGVEIVARRVAMASGGWLTSASITRTISPVAVAAPFSSSLSEWNVQGSFQEF
jgi:hypothetical protein